MPLTREGKLLIFCAPSGAGKSTIVNHLMQKNLGLAFSISCTSRLPRGQEKDGLEYYFISPETFRKKITEEAFAEWEEVYPGCHYGTLSSELERIWASGEHALFDIDVMGGMKLKKDYGAQALSIFVMPPSHEELKIRLSNRATDDETSLKQRLEKAEHEMSFAGKFDRILVNNKLEDALAEAEVLVKAFLEEKASGN